MGMMFAPEADASDARARLVHEENFSRETRLDGEFWTYETGFVRNHELQYYRPENVTVRNGALVIEGRAEHVLNAAFDRASRDWTRAAPSADFTSGSIVSRRPLAYGSVEIIARLPSAAGTWSAIWTLGEDGRPYREIDIVEAVGKQPDTAFTSVHAGATLDRLTDWKAETHVPQSSSEWHAYRLDWRRDRIAVSIDGRSVLTVDPKDAPTDANDPLRRPMNLRINLALGGAWGGAIDKSALPARLEIKSIRVFEDDP